MAFKSLPHVGGVFFFALGGIERHAFAAFCRQTGIFVGLHTQIRYTPRTTIFLFGVGEKRNIDARTRWIRVAEDLKTKCRIFFSLY